MKKILLFIAIILIIPSCNWLFPKCEGYIVYELINYNCKIVNAVDGNNIDTNILDYEKIVFDNLHLDIDGIKKEIEWTENCSYMEDSFVNYITKIDIFSETDYNQSFPANTNLNKLFVELFLYENLVDTFPVISVENENFGLKPTITMFLIEKPKEADTFVFNVDIKINDGRTYNFITNPVIITP